MFFQVGLCTPLQTIIICWWFVIIFGRLWSFVVVCAHLWFLPVFVITESNHHPSVMTKDTKKVILTIQIKIPCIQLGLSQD